MLPFTLLQKLIKVIIIILESMKYIYLTGKQPEVFNKT